MMRLWGNLQFEAGVFLFLVLLLQGCGESSQAGGSGSDETTNAPSFALLDSNEQPVADAWGLVRPAHYRSVIQSHGFADCKGCWTGVSDKRGHFSIDSLPVGDYTFEVRSAYGGCLTLFSINSHGNDVEEEALTLGIAPYGSWEGTIDLPAGVPYVRIVLEGLDRVEYTDSQGRFVINQVPAGNYTVWIYLPDTVQVIAGFSDTLGVGDTVVSEGVKIEEPDLSEWMNSMDVSLDTRGSEMVLAGVVYDFPLLLWLDGESFPFGAQDQGQDLRILDPQGNLLPFHISYWNSKEGLAQVWVRVDSILPNDSMKIAEIRWGQPLAMAKSNGAAVFDTSLGWSGVWDLVGTELDEYNRWLTPDLTAYGHHGVAGDLEGNRATFGAEGAVFQGNQNQSIAIGDVPIDFGQDTFSVELWVVPSDTCGVMLSKRSPDSNMLQSGEKRFFLSSTFARWEVSDGNLLYSSNDSWDAPINVWNYFTLVGYPNSTGDSTILTWYMHGNPAPANPITVPLIGDNFGDSLYLAASSLTEPSFKGTLSHLRISRTARSADWVRLSARTEWRYNPFVTYSRP